MKVLPPRVVLALLTPFLLAAAGCNRIDEFMSLQRELAALQSDVKSEIGDASVQLVNGSTLRVSLIYRGAARPFPDSSRRDSLVDATARLIQRRFKRIEQVNELYVVFSHLGQAGAVGTRINYPYVVPVKHP